MNIYRHELKMHLKSVVIWSVSLFLILLSFLSIFTSIADDAAVMAEAMAKFPEELLIAFGMQNIDWSNILGFFGVAFLFCQICLAIQAANYGFSLVSIEERELTADFLLAKPVGRPKILTSKLLAAFTGLAVTNAVVWVSSFLFLNFFNDGKEFETRPLVLLLLSIVLFQLFFLAVGILISLLVKRVRNVTPFSMGLVFGMYLLNAFGGMIGEDTLEIISPFKHFDPFFILKNEAFDIPLVMLNLSIMVLSLVCSYVLYSRRNIPSVV